MDIVRKQTGENTRAVHLPAPPTPSQQPLGTPVFRTASFSFGTAEEYRAVLNDEMPGYTYSRIDNPTVDAFARAVAALEGVNLPRWPAAQGFASGVTYARRYGLSLALGLAPEDDDDAMEAEGEPKTESKPKTAPLITPLPEIMEPIDEIVAPHVLALEQTTDGKDDWIRWGGALVTALQRADTRADAEKWLALNEPAIERCEAEMPRVAELCCSTADAMLDAICDMRSIVAPISLIAWAENSVAVWMLVICWPISPVAFAVCSASDLTSVATTAKPRPASPARAASMVAFSASRLVCPAIVLIRSTTSPIRPAALVSSVTRSLAVRACSTAPLAMPTDSCTCRRTASFSAER